MILALRQEKFLWKLTLTRVLILTRRCFKFHRLPGHRRPTHPNHLPNNLSSQRLEVRGESNQTGLGIESPYMTLRSRPICSRTECSMISWQMFRYKSFLSMTISLRHWKNQFKVKKTFQCCRLDQKISLSDLRLTIAQKSVWIRRLTNMAIKK